MDALVWNLGGFCDVPPFMSLKQRKRFLSALSQIMLFVDGMHGVISHNETVQWLYTLTGSLVSTLAG